MTDPYIQCPTYENEHFMLRLVTLADANDLLSVYSDETASQYFNSDNCTNNFQYKTLDAMQECLNFWLEQYNDRYYVRFAIIDKVSGSVIGTIELFNRGQLANYSNVGMLRIDLSSEYEKTTAITSLLSLIHREMPKDFGLEHLLTKAIPEASQRVAALTNRGYQLVPDRSLLPYSDYYVKTFIALTV